MTRTGNPFRPHTSLPSRPATWTACFPRSLRTMALLSAASLAVTGCGGGDSQPSAAAGERPAVSSSPAPSSNTTAAGNAAAGNAGASGTTTGHDAHAGHEHTHISTQGRLALAEKEAAALYVFDLDRHAVEARHTLPAAVSEVYASPGRRYAMAVQRPQGVVSFVDGGIWQEDHGDHLHGYRQGSTLLAWQLQGVNPTHVNETAQGTTAIFMDGRSGTTPQVNAAVQVVSDASIAAGKAAGSVALDTPMHGMAQPLGDVMLTVKRSKPATASDVMPDRLQVLTRQGDSYQPQQVIDTVCGVLHGGGTTGNYTLTGCDYGGLLVQRVGSKVTARRVEMEYRVSSVLTHKAWPGHFLGTSNRGTPATTRFTAVDAATAKAVTVKPQGWPEGHVRRTMTLDHDGRLLVLDDQGTLYTLERDNSGWKTVKRTAGLIAQMPAAAPWPALTASGVDDVVYLTDPEAKQLLTVESESHEVKRRDTLGFVPSGVAWMGIEH